MLNSLKSKLALLVRTKVGLAVVAALLLGGGGTALAATTVPGFGQPLGSALESALGGSGDHAGNTSNGDHSGDSGESTGAGDGGGEPTATSSDVSYSTQGTVASIGASSFVVQHGDGQTIVDVNGSTQWKGVSGLGALTTGMTVSVSGTSQEGGAILATMVEVTTSGDPTATPTSTGK